MSTDKKDMQVCLKTNKRRVFLWYESSESHDASTCIEARGALDGGRGWGSQCHMSNSINPHATIFIAKRNTYVPL